TVTLVDSGELIVAARFLGVAHPPGFPLYLMLAHLASVVPIGNVAARVNFASAFFAALAAAMLTLVVTELGTATKGGLRKSARKERPSRSTIRTDNDFLLTIIPAICSGLLLACSRTLWSYATI